MKQHVVPGVALMMFVGGVAACGRSDAQPPPATVTVTSTPAASMTGADLASGSPAAEPAAQVSGSGNPVPEISGPPIIRAITTTPKKLVLADVFEHPDWEEGPVSVPRRSGTIQAVYSRMGCGSNPYLELRFADQTGVLALDLAQALDSRTSGAVLEFKLLADGRLVNTALVRFNGQGHLETELTGVSSVRLEVRHTTAATCQSTAVVTNMSVTPGGS